MSRPLRFLGHPLHPALVHFPMGLLPFSFIGDLISLWRGAPFWGPFAFWTLCAGLLALIPALITGLLDFLSIPEERKEALSAGYWHMSIMVLAATFFAVSFFLRMGATTPLIPTPIFALAFSALGVFTLSVGGYYGGKLVYQYGIGHEEKN